MSRKKGCSNCGKGDRPRHYRRHHHIPAPMRPSWADYGWPWWWSYYSYPRYFNDWPQVRQQMPVQIKEIIVKENNNTYLPLIISISIIIIIALVLFK